jgi:hypothetical protein
MPLPDARNSAVSRVAPVSMWFYSTYLQRAFHSGLVPAARHACICVGRRASFSLLWLLMAMIIDLGGLGGAHRQSRLANARSAQIR